MKNGMARWVPTNFSRAVVITAVSFGALWGCASSPPVTPGTDAGTIEPTPGTTVEVLRPITLTERARLPEENPHLIDVEVMEDRLAFLYDAPVSTLPFAVDDVVSGVRHEGYLRRLTGIVQVSPTRIETTTVHAELGELIGDGHFRVTFEPGDGTGDMAPSGEVGAARAALTSGWSVLSPALGPVVCRGTNSGGLTVTPRFDIDLGMDLDIDINWSTHFLIPRGEIVSAIVALHGELEAGATARATSNASVSCRFSVTEAAMMAGIPVPKAKWTSTFLVGPVPVIVTHTIQPYFEVASAITVETSTATASAMGRLGIRAGTSYNVADGWQPIWEPTRMGDISFNTGMPGTTTLMSTYSAGVSYSMKIYDVFGPGLAVGPRLTAAMSASPDCTWRANLKASLDLTGSVDITVPVIDYKLASFSVRATLAEGTIADEMGSLPWCADAGTMMDAGTMTDAGPADAGPPDAGPGIDAGPRVRGAPCAVPGDCASGYCTDGVCCDWPCSGECQSCIAATSRSPDGTCDAIREDTNPDGECPGLQTCRAYRTTPGTTAYCNAHYGDPCTGEWTSAECPGAGRCIEGVCCDNNNCHMGLSPCSSCLSMYTGFADGDCQTILTPLDPYDTCSGATWVCWGGSATNTCCVAPGSSCVANSDCCSRVCTANTCT